MVTHSFANKYGTSWGTFTGWEFVIGKFTGWEFTGWKFERTGILQVGIHQVGIHWVGGGGGEVGFEFTWGKLSVNLLWPSLYFVSKNVFAIPQGFIKMFHLQQSRYLRFSIVQPFLSSVPFFLSFNSVPFLSIYLLSNHKKM